MSKTFVWTDVLCDYTSGMVVVSAESEADARRVIKESNILSSSKEEVLGEDPKVLEEGEFEYVYGGG